MDGKDKRQIPMDLHVKRNCPALSDPRHNVFHPHFLLGNGHLQTIAASFASRITPQRVQFDREMLKMNDGGVVSLDWAKSGFTNDKLVLILHGLTGGSHETYVQDLILELQDMGLNSVVMNFRGCADTEVVTPQLYSGHYTGDITETVEHILKKKDYRMIGVGFSLGSNVLINYAGTMGNKCPLLACVSVGNPYDFMGAMLALHRSWLGRVYSYKMGQSLADMFDKHKHHFEDKLDLDAIRNVKDIVSFDHLATAPIGGYKTVHDYYRKASSVQRIPDITIPTLLFTAVDDPIAHQELIPWYEVEANPNIILATTSKGGHLGWYRDGWDNIIPTKRWFQRPVAEYIQCMFQVHLLILACSKGKAKTSSPNHSHCQKGCCYHYKIKNQMDRDLKAALGSCPWLPHAQKMITSPLMKQIAVQQSLSLALVV
ncbi:Alpha/Beta hydrolase protein [Gorgonomyces haynaldii]|nr:Alpha/Beta hydrolase protein [Gorgonomyces haynaldii]